MKSVPTWIRTTSIGLAVMSLFALAVGVAGAQRGDGAQAGGGGGQGSGPETGMRDAADAYVNDLASNLGVSPDTLRAAMEQTREDMRPMMEERMGEMRDRMRERRDERGGGPRLGHGEGHGENNRPMGPGGGPLFGQMPFERPGSNAGPGQMIATVAGLLNMQPDDLRSQIASGETLADIAQAQAVDPDTLADQLTSTFIQEHQDQLRSMIREAMDHSFGRRHANEEQ